MKVIYNIGDFKRSLYNAVLVIGIFDGIHRGHQRLIKFAVNRAKKIKTKVIILTFYPHPIQVLYPKSYLSFIISFDYRLKVFKDLGVDVCLIIKFTKKFSRITPDIFVKKYILNKIKPKEIFIGEDFLFGKNQQGTVKYLKEEGNRFGFKVNAVKSIKSGKNKIGSSHIKELIIAGNLKNASKLLGRNVSIMGKVVKGDKRGKILGFPTANLTPRDQVIPPLGVYAVKVAFGTKKYFGMANIGKKPSFKKKNRNINIEVHIFNFNRNLYGETIIVEFLKRIRNEKMFLSSESLIIQLKKDMKEVKSFFNKSIVSN